MRYFILFMLFVVSLIPLETLLLLALESQVFGESVCTISTRVLFILSAISTSGVLITFGIAVQGMKGAK